MELGWEAWRRGVSPAGVGGEQWELNPRTVGTQFKAVHTAWLEGEVHCWASSWGQAEAGGASVSMYKSGQGGPGSGPGQREMVIGGS